jgi:hypothetical protein
MRDRRDSTRKFLRFSALTGLVAGMLLAMTGLSSAAETYTFAGLRWGSSPAEVRKALKAQGFSVRRTVKGARRELAENGAWGEWVRKDRGKRLIARGKVGGMRSNVELVFGSNNRLQRVIVSWRDWNGTIPHATRLTKVATAVTKQLESQYGRSNERRDPFGWIDTAKWLPAADGSGMEVIIRGTNGMMFYPGDKTGVRMNFWNAKYGGRGGTQTAGGSKGGSTTLPKFGPGTGVSRTQEVSQPATGAPLSINREDNF